VELRAAVPGDELAVGRVHIRAWQGGYRGLMPDAYLDGLRAEDRAARYRFDGSGPHTVVALIDGAICGFVTTSGNEIVALNVDPDAWRCGVGRALIADARAAMVASGHRESILWVLDGNDRGHRFYVADGWAHDGTRKVAEVWGISVTELLYRRAL